MLVFFLAVNCGSLTDPVDGKVHAKLTTFEAVATYNCKRGHVLIGDITRTCQANGLWSGSQPKCVSRKYNCEGLMHIIIMHLKICAWNGLYFLLSYFV